MRKTVQIEIGVTPYDLAYEFWKMGADSQAEFFNTLAGYVAHERWRFLMQMQYVTDCENLTDAGRQIMRTIGDYSERNAGERDEPQAEGKVGP